MAGSALYMACGRPVYRLIRNVCLTLGLVLALALGVYLLSSVRLAYRSGFSPEPTVTRATLAVDPVQVKTPPALALHLVEEHRLRGEIVRVASRRRTVRSHC